MAEDLYQLLGVSRSASADEVKKAYRRLARKHHPDVNPGDKVAEDKFKKLSAAFEVLGDPKKRKLYDEFGEDAAKFGFDEQKAEQFRAYRAASSSQASRGYGRGGIPFDMGGEGVDIGDLFGELFGRAGRGGGGAAGFDPSEVLGRMGGRRAGPVPGDDLSARVGLSLAEALQGTERTLNVRRPRPDGTEESRQLTVKIPPGVQTGSKVRLAGQGTAGERGGPPGDLYIETEVAEHPLVRREGDDLHMDLPITVSEALLGAEVRVPTFQGEVTVRVPAGSQSGKKMRLRGRGAPSLRGGNQGDLYLNLQVRVPEEADDTARAAAEALQRAYRGDVRAQLKL